MGTYRPLTLPFNVTVAARERGVGGIQAVNYRSHNNSKPNTPSKPPSAQRSQPLSLQERFRYTGVDGCFLKFDRKRHCVIRCNRNDCWE